MKRPIVLTAAFLMLTGAAAAQTAPKTTTAQTAAAESERKEHAAKKDNVPVELKAGDKITRGAALSQEAEKISLADALKNPEKYADKTVAVAGVIVRSCKAEGCWMQLAPAKDGESVRVTFADHAFFIPLNAAGLTARAEGKFSVKKLSKAEVDHLVNEDGAKFDKRNPDGSVTEVSFVATGVELSKE